MKFPFTTRYAVFSAVAYALVAAVALTLMAATVVKKVSEFPSVTTPGTNDLFLLALPTTNNAIKYSDLKSSINATNLTLSVNGTNATTPNIADTASVTWTKSGSNLTATAISAVSVNGTNVTTPNVQDTASVTWSKSGSNLTATAAGGDASAPINNFYSTNNFFISGKGNTLILTNQLIFEQAALTYATNVVLDFATQAYKTVALTGNITYATTNLGAGRSVTVKLLGDGTARTLTFPAWIFLGAVAPTTLATNKTAVLTVTAFGSTDATCVAAYAAEP